MPDTKISAMTNGGAVQATDNIPAVRAGANVRVQVGTAAAAATTDFATAAQGVLAASAVQPGAITTSGLTQATARLLGRSTAGTGAIEAITLGTNLSFSGTTLNATGGGTPGGSDTQVQFNDAGAFAGATMTWDKTTSTLTLPSGMTAGGGGFVIKGTSGQAFVWNGGAIGWSSSATVSQSSTMDVSLFRDAANTLALRNGTNVQTLRIERSYTDGSNRGYTALTQHATTGFILDSVSMGSVGAPTNILDVRSNGTNRFTIAANGFISTTGSFSCGSNIVAVGTLSAGQSITAGTFFEGAEQGSDPAAPAANGFRIYARDNGLGATQLCTRFATGGIKILARESRFEAVSAGRTLTATDSGLVFNTASTSRAFTVNSGYGDGFEQVIVNGPCTWVAGGGVTLTDNRTAGAGYDYCQLVQVATDTYRVTGVTL